jgi:DNA-3-methyladenine glycosylase II
MAGSESSLLHLKKDRSLRKVIDQVGTIRIKKDLDLYLSLMRAIVGQQLSMKAANTIWERFLGLFKDRYPAAGEVLKLSDDKLRSVGLSYQKAGYIRNIATFSLDKTLDYKKLKSMADEDLIEYLVTIKGVGRWTVEMILMFNLNRKDILPKGDLGIQQGIKNLYSIEPASKKELFASMEAIAEKWRPYRTLACMYIWRHKDAVKESKKNSK